MELYRRFTITENADASRQRIIGYLEGAGYRLLSTEPLLYQRGSLLGSLASFSPKRWQVKAKVETKPTSDQATEVAVSYGVNTTGQFVTKKERDFWERELDGLVVAAGGDKASVSMAPSVEAGVEAKLKLQSQLVGGANWFFWIAGLSLLNSVILIAGGNWRFVIGLGITQFVDGFVHALTSEIEPQAAMVFKVLGFIVALGIAGIFVLFGALARRRHRWSFIVGMVLYALDGFLLLFFQDYLGVGFHLLALFGLYNGLRASNELKRAYREIT